MIFMDGWMDGWMDGEMTHNLYGSRIKMKVNVFENRLRKKKVI